MKVKIGDKTYDSNEQPIMLILDDIDKQRLSWMGEQNKYCNYPEGMDINKIIKFMEE
jgi:hypothetical protein